MLLLLLQRENSSHGDMAVMDSLDMEIKVICMLPVILNLKIKLRRYPVEEHILPLSHNKANFMFSEEEVKVN